MASPDALHALEKGVESWATFASHAKPPIDLKIADLRTRDLSGRTFKQCIFDGSDFESTSLDNCTFIDCSLKDVSLEKVSLVACVFDNVDLSRSNLQHATIRDARLGRVKLIGADLRFLSLENCTLDGCEFGPGHIDGAAIKGCSFKRCALSNMDGANVNMTRCKLLESGVTDVVLRSSKVHETSFENTTLSSFSVLAGAVSDSAFKASEISEMRLDDSEISRLDFTDSVLKRVSLKQFDLPHSTMLDVVIVDCEWPDQAGTTSALGRYRPSASLLGHPVQDVRGLSPMLRRDIADAQYLTEMHHRTTDPFHRGLLRAWGLSCSFGTSLTRLSIVAGLSVLLMAVLALSIDNKLSVSSMNWSDLWDEFVIVGSSLFGFSPDVGQVPSEGHAIVLPAARILGFVLLGLWIGIAANRLGRLSSE